MPGVYSGVIQRSNMPGVYSGVIQRSNMPGVYSGVLLSVVLFAMASSQAAGPKYCKTKLQSCLRTNSEVSCNLWYFGCIRKYCDRIASYSKTAKITGAKRTTCYVKYGLVVMVPAIT
ncbi:hypothetical protein ScPMuIL_015850 [Solemya velum]